MNARCFLVLGALTAISCSNGTSKPEGGNSQKGGMGGLNVGGTGGANPGSTTTASGGTTTATGGTTTASGGTTTASGGTTTASGGTTTATGGTTSAGGGTTTATGGTTTAAGGTTTATGGTTTASGGTTTAAEGTTGSSTQDGVLAFPTAEGHGKFTRGGRGGKVYEVVNLNDSGPGSLREAVEATSPRTVVFRVSGTITLEKELVITSPNITIAGQTAPGDGICIKKNPLKIQASEVILRYLRIRLGDEARADVDAFNGVDQKNIVLDHLSVSWGVHETMSLYHCENITVQWCLVSESLYNSGQSRSMGFGAIWGSHKGTYHHNLLAHHASRTPRFIGGGGDTDYRNNVIYNWGYQGAYGGEKKQFGDDRYTFSNINLVANYYKPGPATKTGDVAYRITEPSSRDDLPEDYGNWYIANNVVVGNEIVTADNWGKGVQKPAIKLEAPWAAMPIEQQTAEAAYDLVLKQVGATLPKRDSVDTRVIEETRNGNATFEGPTYETEKSVADKTKMSGIIDSQADVGGWPLLNSAPPPIDSDHDGMPDAWETANRLDPQNPADGNQVGTNGYTQLENYLNSIQ